VTGATIQAQDIMADLHAKARELEHLAAQLAEVSEAIDGTATKPGVQDEYDAWIDNYEVGLWTAHVDDSAKLPAKDLRRQMAHRAMPPELYGRYFALVRTRERMSKRISALKSSVEASRSLLSALKEGLV
jgi:hypothetical protein